MRAKTGTMAEATALADALLGFFAARGCAVPRIGLLQPADPFLDTVGEDLRGRIFITADRHGASLCLRPEFTIPVARHHLAQARGAARYAYAGTVFRQRADEPIEFRQAGVEDIGAADRTAADAAAIRDCAGALALAGVGDAELVMGDQALFEAALAALGLPPAWRARLARAFGDMAVLRADLARLERGNGDALAGIPDKVAAMVESGERDSVTAWIADAMQEAGLSQSGGRTAGEIAARLFAKAELAAFRLAPEKLTALEAFLAIDAPAAEAVARIERLGVEHGLDLAEALGGFAARLAAIADTGLAPRYVAAFGRRLDYYTGLVFEFRQAGQRRPLAGGGRYDRLMNLLGSEAPVPAVGFSIWLDRLQAEGEAGR